MRVRVLSYNVAGFAKRIPAKEPGSQLEVQCTLDDITATLKKIKPDVLCLQEVDLSRWSVDIRERVGAALGVDTSHVLHFGHTKKGTYGNLIASRLPIRLRIQEHLDGGSRIEFGGKVHQIIRGLLVADIYQEHPVRGKAHLKPFFSVANTHLDHICEDERRTQLGHVAKVLSGVPGPVVLCGDLNALTREDYSSHEWDLIKKRHETNGWTPPRHGCLQVLAEKRFIDTFAHHHTEKRVVPSFKHTSYAGVRIDYCFACSDFQEHFTIDDAWIDGDIHHSDHFPHVVDFIRQSPSQL